MFLESENPFFWGNHWADQLLLFLFEVKRWMNSIIILSKLWQFSYLKLELDVWVLLFFWGRHNWIVWTLKASINYLGNHMEPFLNNSFRKIQLDYPDDNFLDSWIEMFIDLNCRRSFGKVKKKVHQSCKKKWPERGKK